MLHWLEINHEHRAQPFGFFACHADSGILDRELQVVVLELDIDTNVPLDGEFLSILDQVYEYLLDTPRVGSELDLLVSDFVDDIKANAFLGDGVGKQALDREEKIRDLNNGEERTSSSLS